VHNASSREGAEEVARQAREMGRRAWVVSGDLSCRTDIRTVAEAAKELSGGELDLLVNNAANFERVAPEELSIEHWDRAIALNATAPYLLTLELAGALRAARGSMIAIACLSAARPWKNYVPYSVSKAALAHSVRGLALALAPDVRVNGVAPGAVLIPDDYDADRRRRLKNRIPAGRFGEPEDVARAVVFLAQNDYVTGQILGVDGGLGLV